MSSASVQDLTLFLAFDVLNAERDEDDLGQRQDAVSVERELEGDAAGVG